MTKLEDFIKTATKRQRETEGIRMIKWDIIAGNKNNKKRKRIQSDTNETMINSTTIQTGLKRYRS